LLFPDNRDSNSYFEEKNGRGFEQQAHEAHQHQVFLYHRQIAKEESLGQWCLQHMIADYAAKPPLQGATAG
jgi:hypothetical protein